MSSIQSHNGSKAEEVHFSRYGHNVWHEVPPTLKEILQAQEKKRNFDYEPNLYLPTPDLLKMYQTMNEYYDGDDNLFPGHEIQSLLPAKYKALRDDYTATPTRMKKLKEENRHKVYGAGYTPCTAIRLAKERLTLRNPNFEDIERTRRLLNENGIIAIVDYIKKQDADRFEDDQKKYDTYLIVLDHQLDYSTGRLIEHGISHVSMKALAAAIHTGIISEDYLDRNSINGKLGLLPGLLKQLQTDGHFDPPPALKEPQSNNHSQAEQDDSHISEKAFENYSGAFELPDGYVTEKQGRQYYKKRWQQDVKNDRDARLGRDVRHK